MSNGLMFLASEFVPSITAELPPIPAYSSLSNNTGVITAPSAVQQFILGGASPTDARNPFYAASFVVPSLTQGNNYTEVALQGLNSGSSAASDFDVIADNGTASTHRIAVGINSSGYASGGNSTFPFGANNTYLISFSDDLYVGASTANTTHIFSNNADVAQFLSTAINVPSTVSSGLQLFNTSDQVTNFEKLQVNWSSNIAMISTLSGGTGNARPIELATGAGRNVFLGTAVTGGGMFQFNGISTATAGNFIGATGTGTGGAGIAQVGAQFTYTVNQTSTAAFTDLLVNRTNSNPGSGTQRLLDLQVGSSSMFNVNTGGSGVFVGNVSVTPGSASFPSFNWNTGTTTGTYFANPGIGFSVAGTQVGSMLSSQIRYVNGAFSSPAYSFLNDSQTGIYLNSVGVLGFGAANTNAGMWSSTLLTVNTGLSAGGTAYSYGAPSITGATALSVPATTYTLTGTVTTANFQGTYFGIPTFTNASAGTLANASTVYIAGQPAAAGSQVITTPWSLYVASGNVFLGNQVNGSGWVMNNSGRLTTYNNVTTAGTGVTPVVAAPRQTAVTNATATLATYTVPGADSTYRISANVQVTAATAAAMTVVCTYTDETNTSRAQTIPFCQLAGTFLTSITNVTGVGPYEGATLEIRCKASTTIVFTTAGTVTGITYNVEGTVTQLA